MRDRNENPAGEARAKRAPKRKFVAAILGDKLITTILKNTPK